MEPVASSPPLGERQIAERVGATALRRGAAYFASGAVFDERREGTTLRARCEGSEPEPYRVWAALDARGVAASGCSCPAGGEGRCKHVAAVLLGFAREPAAFVRTESVGALLARLERRALEALVLRLLARRPELDELLDAERAPRGERAATLRHRVGEVFRRAGSGDVSAEATARALRGLLEGEASEETSEAHATVAAAVLVRRGRVPDPDGVLARLAEGCVARAVEALPRGPAARARALGALFELWRADAAEGGRWLARAVGGALARHGTAEDRRAVAAWLRPLAERAEGWARRVCDALRVDLEGDALDDEAYLALCEQAGRAAPRLARLLARGRGEEAAREAATARAEELLELARGAPDEPAVEALLAARCEGAPDARLLEHLRDARAGRGDARGALAAAEALFFLRPDLPGYHALCARAEALGDAAHARARVSEQLAARAHPLLAEIALDESRPADALALALAESTRGARWTPLRTRLADALERDRPRDALALSLRAADDLIAARGRANYREAARVLERARSLFARLGEHRAYEQHVRALRERHAELPALLEELDAAGEADGAEGSTPFPAIDG